MTIVLFSAVNLGVDSTLFLFQHFIEKETWSPNFLVTIICFTLFKDEWLNYLSDWSNLRRARPVLAVRILQSQIHHILRTCCAEKWKCPLCGWPNTGVLQAPQAVVYVGTPQEWRAAPPTPILGENTRFSSNFWRRFSRRLSVYRRRRLLVRIHIRRELPFWSARSWPYRYHHHHPLIQKKPLGQVSSQRI
jgi:hypothetical protein